jgi:hypothetical protein
VSKDYPRAGEPWTVAEDRRLLRLMSAAVKKTTRSPFSYLPDSPSAEVARALGRTAEGIMARFAILRVAEQHRAADAPPHASGFDSMGEGAGI